MYPFVLEEAPADDKACSGTQVGKSLPIISPKPCFPIISLYPWLLLPILALKSPMVTMMFRLGHAWMMVNSLFIKILFDILLALIGRGIALDNIHVDPPVRCAEAGSEDPWAMCLPSNESSLCRLRQHQGYSLAVRRVCFLVA